jgi:hypothetical protein
MLPTEPAQTLAITLTHGFPQSIQANAGLRHDRFLPQSSNSLFTSPCNMGVT